MSEENLPSTSAKTTPNSTFQSIYQEIRSDPFANLPSLLFLATTAFGLFTLFSFLLTDLFTLPFILIASIASLYAVWHLHILGTLKTQIEQLSHENTRYAKENEQLASNNQHLKTQIDHLETTLADLKANNDRLHQELQGLQQLRQGLEQFADEQERDFGQLLSEANDSFSRLERITSANEHALLQRIAQDLEFLDRHVGMQKNEYQRFVQRIPKHLQPAFQSLAKNSFHELAGDNATIEHQELQPMLSALIALKSAVKA